MRAHPYIYSNLKAKHYRKRKQRDGIPKYYPKSGISKSIYISQCIVIFVKYEAPVVVKTKLLCECEKRNKVERE